MKTVASNAPYALGRNVDYAYWAKESRKLGEFLLAIF
jgi:hypothetical protein